MGKTQIKIAMMADVVGYSHLVHRNRELAATMLTEHRVVFEQYIQHHHGRLVNFTGDSIFAIFDSAIDSVLAAIEIQKRLARMTVENPSKHPMIFRIGIDMGDMLGDADGELYGDAINIAARLEKHADPGGLCLSGDIRRQVYNRVDVEFDDLGELELHNIEVPVRAFKAAVETAKGKKGGKHPRKTDAAAAMALGLAPEAGITPPTDKDRNQYVRKAFGFVRDYFKHNLDELRGLRKSLDTDFEMLDNRRFACRVYVNGQEKALATVWMGNTLGGSIAQIYYSNEYKGSDYSGDFNEFIQISDEENVLALSAMGIPLFSDPDLNLKRLSMEDAAEYYWRLFRQQLWQSAVP